MGLLSFKHRLISLLSPYGLRRFLYCLPKNGKILDVGCGNDSPYKIKTQLPDAHYCGIDVSDYHQNKPILADEYLICTPDEFALTIERQNQFQDGVISSHNIEHCNDLAGTIRAICSRLKPGGLIYISFPSERSINFPSRNGCLNYYDDPTHREIPVFDQIIKLIKESGCEIVISKKIYQPRLLYAIGFFLEPISRARNQVMIGTWEYYGFESVIWAKKK